MGRIVQSVVGKFARYCLLCCGFAGCMHTLQAQDQETMPWPVSRGIYAGPAYVFTDIVYNNYGGLIGLEWNAQPKWWLQAECAVAYRKEPYFSNPELERSQFTTQLSFIANYDLLEKFGFYKLRLGGGLGVNTLLLQYYDYLEYWNGELEEANRATAVVFSPFLSMILENDFRIIDQHVLFLKMNIQLINYPLRNPEAITLSDGVQRMRIYDMREAAYISIGWRYLFD